MLGDGGASLVGQHDQAHVAPEREVRFRFDRPQL
jgi:hypothetical protein